jgi:hypothetical protein
MSVFIEGDRTLFVSKGAVDRFKKDVKEVSHTDLIDNSKYLKDGYCFNFVKKDNDITAKITAVVTSQVPVTFPVNIEDKRRQLREKLHMIKKARSGDAFKHLESLKRTVPDKIYKSYSHLMKNYGLPNIPAPDEVINNIEKYRTQIASVMGLTTQVCNISGASNAIKHYFNALGQFLGIEPINMSSQMSQLQNQTRGKITDNSDTEDEDDAPELIETNDN